MADEIMERAAKFLSSQRFERTTEKFMREHAEVFYDAAKLPSGEVEHKHEFYEIHKQFLSMFEAELEDFLKDEGVKVDEFFEQCRDAEEGKFTPLFEDHKYKWLVDAMLMYMDYNYFYGIMVNEARRQLAK